MHNGGFFLVMLKVEANEVLGHKRQQLGDVHKEVLLWWEG